MAMRRARRAGILETALDLTPLIDVVFLLVIFLLISTTFKKRQLALEVNLPKVGASEFRIRGMEHQLRIDTQGSMYLCPNQVVTESTDVLKCTAPASRAKLTEAFRKLQDKFPGVRLGVYADADVPYQEIVKVIAAATTVGMDLNLPYDVNPNAQ
jgi:biopolymer transport protein ExbD